MKSPIEPLRVLTVIGDLAGGGAEREISNLLHGLPRERFDIHLAVLRPIFKYPVPPDVAVRVLHKSRPWHVFRVISRLGRMIEEIRPDLVYSKTLFPSLITGQVLGRKRRIGWVARLTSAPEHQLRGWRGIWGRRVLPGADRLITPSIGAARAVESCLGLPPGKVRAVDNPLDIESFSAPDEPLPFPRPRFLIVHAGRLHSLKDQAMLLRAFAYADVEGSELWVLGEGPEEDRLRRLARELGIAERVRWLGYRENPYSYFRAADCFALSSRWEGLPNVVIEAMACGTPVVSTMCRYGPAELIEDELTGRLVSPGDWRAMAEVLVEWSSSPGSLQTMGSRASRVIRGRFDLERIIGEFAEIFEEAAATRGSPRATKR